MATYYARTNGPAHPHGPPREAATLPMVDWWHEEYCFWSTFPPQPYELKEQEGSDDEAELLLAAYNVGVALACLGRCLGCAPPLSDDDFIDEARNFDIYARDRVCDGDVLWPPRWQRPGRTNDHVVDDH